MNTDGSGQINLTNNPASDWFPYWSPDGSKIVFNSNRSGNWDIYVMDSDGSNPTRLTNNPEDEYRATWSPDGSKIAFDSEYEISTMDANGSNQTRITFNSNSDTPFWARPGFHVTPGVVALTTPNGGEIWPAGSTQNISWTSSGVSNVMLQVSTDGGGAWETIVTSNPANTGSYQWTLPLTATAGAIIQISDASNSSVSDQSDATFIIYNPAEGYVIGKGWIMSPAGAYIADPTMSGRATFEFSSQYQKNATEPTGSTKFQFKVANLLLVSTDYNWLVVAGEKAKYKGVGTINGAGTYNFMLTAIDGALLGVPGPDQFRIRITDGETLVYDNIVVGSNDVDNYDTIVINGGSITIKPPKPSKGGKPTAKEVAVPDKFTLYNNYPNPFNPSTSIQFDVPVASNVSLKVFNIQGQEVATLTNQQFFAPGKYTLQFDASYLATGVYFCRMTSGTYCDVRRMVFMK